MRQCLTRKKSRTSVSDLSAIMKCNAFTVDLFAILKYSDASSNFDREPVEFYSSFKMLFYHVHHFGFFL